MGMKINKITFFATAKFVEALKHLPVAGFQHEVFKMCAEN